MVQDTKEEKKGEEDQEEKGEEEEALSAEVECLQMVRWWPKTRMEHDADVVAGSHILWEMVWWMILFCNIKLPLYGY